MARKDKRGVVIPAPLQFSNPATAALPRYDDDLRGPAVSDAYELSRCRIDLAERSDLWPLPDQIPPGLRDQSQKIPTAQRADWLRRQVNLNEVDQLISSAMRSGNLAIWVAPLGEPERQVAPGALVEVDDATLASGVYRPPNDRGWLYGRPLFVKHEDWVAFVRKTDRVKLQGDETENPSANRQLNHSEVISTAATMLKEQPSLSKGSAAASIVAELPVNPRTGKPRDTRHIERIIAHLWEGGIPESPT